MLISRLNLIYDFDFSKFKKYFSEFTETEISPNYYIYFNPLFFLTIICKKDKTIFEIQDKDLSFPSNQLDMSKIPVCKIFADIPPDKILIDFQDNNDVNLEGWSKDQNFFQKGEFKLFKRCENTINFSSISTKNNFLDFNEFIQIFNKTISAI